VARLTKEMKFIFDADHQNFMPCKQTLQSAGFDVKSVEDVEMKAGESYLIGTGVKIKSAPNDFYLELHPRSSIRYKAGCEGVGIIDADFRDEIKVILHPKKDFVILKGDRIAQLIPKRVYDVMEASVKQSSRNGGFGSTN